MDPERWRQVKRLFEAVLDLDAPERDRVLGERCATDPALRDEVESLLQADLSATDPPDPGGQLEQEALPSIERYEVLHRLDSGGMGTVFLARQLDPPREVALKVVRGAVSTPEVLARFDGERKLLARLSHPNIAGVFDAGSTEDGRPYFAM